jgi:hypothetical protein
LQGDAAGLESRWLGGKGTALQLYWLTKEEIAIIEETSNLQPSNPKK